MNNLKHKRDDHDLGDPADQWTLCFGGSWESVGNVRRKGRSGSPNNIPSDDQRGGVGKRRITKERTNGQKKS
jgi:hypothetical protein